MSSKGRWPGTWRAICDRCGFEFPSDKLRKDWQGLMVCEDDWEHRHPQELIRAPRSEKAPPWTRPEAPDQFVHVCTLWTSSPLADYGTADCATADGNTNISLLADTFGDDAIAIADIAVASLSITDIGFPF